MTSQIVQREMIAITMELKKQVRSFIFIKVSVLSNAHVTQTNFDPLNSITKLTLAILISSSCYDSGWENK